MEERATKGFSGIPDAIVHRGSLFWLSIGLLFFCLWLSGRVSALQPETPGSRVQPSKASVQPGDVHALARLEPTSGLIIVGARPGARIDRIEVGPADSVTPGQVLAILEGHNQARAQLALAEAQKTRALHQRSLQKQKLALEREQFDRLQKSKLESAMRSLLVQATV